MSPFELCYHHAMGDAAFILGHNSILYLDSRKETELFLCASCSYVIAYFAFQIRLRVPWLVNNNFYLGVMRLNKWVRDEKIGSLLRCHWSLSFSFTSRGYKSWARNGVSTDIEYGDISEGAFDERNDTSIIFLERLAVILLCRWSLRTRGDIQLHEREYFQF